MVNKSILDDIKKIKKLDVENVLESVQFFGEQIRQAWQEFKKINIPKDFKNFNKVIINGMGGSALGGHIIQSVFFNELKVPITVINSYNIPASMDKNTLYIVSSYSGNTEEPITGIGEAKKKGAKIFGIASGGALADLIRQGKISGYIFKPNFNPCGQPRMGLGYSLAAQLSLLKKIGLIAVSDQEIDKILAIISRLDLKFGVKNPVANNVAKKIAKRSVGKSFAVVASEFLAGNAHVFANQINETGKTFSGYYLIPELNHHLLEGLKYPKANSKNLFFIFLDSGLYYPKNQIRLKITKEIVKKNNVDFEFYKLSSPTKLSQSFEALIFSGYVTFYLAILNSINPNSIPWVNYFKEQLKKYS